MFAEPKKSYGDGVFEENRVAHKEKRRVSCRRVPDTEKHPWPTCYMQEEGETEKAWRFERYADTSGKNGAIMPKY